MAEHGDNVEAALALDVHEVRVRGLNQALLLVHALLHGGRGIKQVYNQLNKISISVQISYNIERGVERARKHPLCSL